MNENERGLLQLIAGGLVGYIVYKVIEVLYISSKMEEAFGVSAWDIISYQ